MAQSQSKPLLQQMKESGRQLISETGKKIRQAKEYATEELIPAVKEEFHEVLPSYDYKIWKLGFGKHATPEETAQFKKADLEKDEKTKNRLMNIVSERKKAEYERQKPQGQDAVQQTDQSK